MDLFRPIDPNHRHDPLTARNSGATVPASTRIRAANSHLDPEEALMTIEWNGMEWNGME